MNGERLLRSGTKDKKADVNFTDETSRGSLASPDANNDAEDANTDAMSSTLRSVVSEVMARGLDEIKSQMKKDLSTFREKIKDDMKAQMDELSSTINQKIQAATGQIEEATQRLEEVERNAAESERWDLAVKDVLLDLLNNQRILQNKLSDQESRSRRNNVRLYGVPESATPESSSITQFVENLIMTELGDGLDIQQRADLGIERAHRALGPPPPPGAPPRSIVVRFLRFTTKENVLKVAWKKQLHVQNKRVFFDHDYAADVQQKRKEYTPIKKALKENRIHFQTPLTKMRIHFHNGTITCNDAQEAAEELEKRGYQVGPIRVKRPTEHNAESLSKLLPWRIAGGTRRSLSEYQEGIRERLQEFKRVDQED